MGLDPDYCISEYRYTYLSRLRETLYGEFMTIFIDDRTTFYQKDSSVTKNPTLSPKAYKLVLKKRTDASLDGWKGVNGGNTIDSMPRSSVRSWGAPPVTPVLRNKALAKFKESLGDQASVQTDFHERQGTIDQFTGDGAKTLLKAMSALIRKDKKMLKAMFVSYKERKAIDKAADVPSMWLAVKFGLEPTFSSLQDVIRVCTQDPYTRIAEGVASYDHSVGVFNKQQGNTPAVVINESGRLIVKFGGQIKNVNSNLLLAQDLGLLSPISSLYAAAPWSWALDYVVNASEFLSNADPFFPAGDLVGTYETHYYNGTYSYHERRDNSFTNYVNGQYVKERVSADYAYKTSGTIVYMVRSINPSLMFKPVINNRLNLTRFSYLMSAVALTAKGKF